MKAGEALGASRVRRGIRAPAAPRSALRRGGRPPRREVLRFLGVGATCFAVTCAINYLLKLTVLTAEAVTALVVATVTATLLSFALNRQWTFRTRGGRALPYEAVLFLGVNGIATVINAAPLWIARYVLDLRVPEVSRLVQEASDLVSGIVLGTALAMGFRLWAYRRWVFPTVRPTESDLRPWRPDRPPADDGAGTCDSGRLR